MEPEDTTAGRPEMPQDTDISVRPTFIRHRLIDIQLELEALSLRKANLEAENRNLLRELSAIERPAPPKARPRMCNICRKPTMDMFGGVPQCAKHIAGGNQQVASILETLLYG